MLRDVTPLLNENDDIDRHVQELCALDIFIPSVEMHNGMYSFRHALIQEVVYGLLLTTQRREIHRYIAEWYESHHRHSLRQFHAILAHHWLEAADLDKAAVYLERAGEQALRSGAYLEAIRFFLAAIRAGEERVFGRSNKADAAIRHARWERQTAEAHFALGQFWESRQHAEKALALLDAKVPRTRYAQALSLVGELLSQARHRMLDQVS